MKTATCLAALLALLGFAAGRAEALSEGIYDQARTGCTCHGIGNPLVNTTTQLKIDGLPSGGYVPGTPYTLTVWVLGAAIPLPGQGLAAENFRGFNLEVTAGPLDPVDRSVQTDIRSECILMQRAKACDPATNCGVTIESPDISCTSVGECYFRYCSTPGTSGCRACSTLLFAQATHTNLGGFGPAAGTPAEDFTDGNNVLMWQVRWTAPDPGVGDVRFYLAGNVVNGNGSQDLGDVWSVLPSPIVVAQATP
jgi:hypothetical protein